MAEKPDEKIKGFIKKVREHYNIEKAILFGSRARGDYLLNSDYDVILVSKDFKDILFTQRMADMLLYWDGLIDIEPICYTPEEFKRKKKQIGIIKQAVKEGIVI